MVKTALRMLVLTAVLVPATLYRPAAAGAQPVSPSLRFATSPGYPLAIQGTGWRAGSRLVFWITAGAMVTGREIVTSPAGSFVIGIKGLSLCARPRFRAADLAGHRAQLHGPPLGCASPAVVPIPRLKLLVGNSAAPAVVRIYDRSPARVTMHLGDELYLWEPGTTAPALLPTPQDNHLILIGKGTTPPRACPEVGCDAGFYWQYVAATSGQTGLILSPACRLATPPCLAPEFLIAVEVLS